MSTYTNYFVANVNSNESVLHFDSWAIWQRFNDTNVIETTTAARKAYLAEITAAIKWGNNNGRAEFVTKLDKLQKHIDKMSAVSFYFICY